MAAEVVVAAAVVQVVEVVVVDQNQNLGAAFRDSRHCGWD